MLKEPREDSHSQRRVRKESSIAERSVGNRARKSAPPSSRKSYKSSRPSTPLVEEDGESDGSAKESEEAGGGFAQELVLNQVFTLNQRELATILKVPRVGYAEYAKGTWPSSVAKLDVFARLGLDPAAKGIRENVNMDVLPRILHSILVSNITPRKQKHNVVVFQDMLLVDQILQRKPVSIPFQVMRHMDNNKDNPSNGLPYPQFVKQILQYWEIYSPTSEKVLSSALCDE
ncbi:hypothetical protein QQ045_008274 [Rhodiola kirilowii]